MPSDREHGRAGQTIEVSEKTRKRYDEKKAEMDAADPDLPDMSNDQFMKCLLDTVEAVENGFYDETLQEEPIELYRCTECGKISVDLGWLHGHIEKHRGYFGWLQVPFTKTAPANVPELMDRTEVIKVTDYDILDKPENYE